MFIKPTSPENARTIASVQVMLAELPIGGSATYGQLSQIGGKDIQKKFRYLLDKAIESAERELGCAFACVRGYGIKRLLSSDAPKIGLSSLRRCRATARRGKKRLDRLNGNSHTPSEQREIIGYSAMLGAIYMLSDGRKAKAIAVVADPTRPIPPANILEMFRAS